MHPLYLDLQKKTLGGVGKYTSKKLCVAFSLTFKIYLLTPLSHPPQKERLSSCIILHMQISQLLYSIS